MPSIHIEAGLRRFVVERAHSCCEYCLLPSEEADFPHEIDHYIPIVHGGKMESSNLVLACLRCNRHKGTNLAALDPVDGSLVAVFTPRRQFWHDHFTLVGAFIIGVTPTGRATVGLLKMNDDVRVERRKSLIEAGRYTPSSNY